MKKLILTTLSIGLAFGSFAQQNLNLKNQGVLDNSPRKAKAKSGLSKSERSEWYNPLDILANGDFKTYVGFMMFDSLANYKDASGVASQGRTLQGVGTIIDPKDDAIDLGADPTIKMSKFTNYSVDSINFRYSYVRRVDSTVDGVGTTVPIIDTLFVYYFSGSQITKRPKNTTWGSAPYGYLGYDFIKRRPTNYLSIDTVLLTSEYSTGAPSTTGWSSAEISLKPNVPINFNSNGGSNANNLVGYAFFFKNGTTYDNTYTYEDRRDSVTAASNKWVNYFLYRFGANEGTDLVSTFYNASLMVPQEFSYKTTNGWNGWVTGLAYNNNQYIDAGVKLSSINIGVKEVPNSFSLGDAFPNPSSQDVTIAFDLKSNNNVTIKLVNLVGQEVMNIANDHFSAGANEVKFNVSNLTAGVYFYTMTVDGVSQSQKIMIK